MDTDPAPTRRPARPWRRRAVVVAIPVAALVLWTAFPWLARQVPVGAFEFTTLAEPAGFRALAAGTVSGAPDLLAGISAAAPVVDAPEGVAFCRALFGAPLRPEGVVPIAYFTDFRCPYCRILSTYLDAIEADRDAGVRIARHEWPILGEASEIAARATLAARTQGAGAAFHDRLMRSSFLPTPAYLRSIAGRVGVDANRLLHDMSGAAVDRALAETRRLAAILGFRGTPGLVVGRTVVTGAIGEAELRALVARERADGPVPICQDGAPGR